MIVQHERFDARIIQQVIAALPGPVYACDAAGVIRVWNARMVEIWGREPDADTRYCAARVYGPDGSPYGADQAAAAETLRTGGPAVSAGFVERPDGSRTWMRSRSAPLRDGDLTIGVLVVLDDVEGPEAGAPFWSGQHRHHAVAVDQPDLVCRFLADGTLTFANEAYCRFFGFARDEVIGTPYAPIVHPDDADDVQALLGTLTPANPVVLIENRVRRADGAIRWTRWISRAIYDARGGLIELQSTGRDITERKQAEEDAGRLAAIVTGAESAIFSMSLDGVIRSWNRAAERTFGYQAEDAIGRSFQFLVPPERLDEAAGIQARLLHGETVDHFETERRHRDGRLIPVSLTVSPILDASGRMIGISKIARDITARKRAQRELEERESRFRLMADQAPVLIWIADTNHGAVYFNRPWLAFTGVPLEAQVGDGWMQTVHPDDREQVAASFRDHVERRQPFTMEFRLWHHSGDYRWVQDTGHPLILPDGTFNGYIGSCVDVHERKSADDRTRRILEGISDAFSAVDREWRFTYVNDHFTRLAGRPREKLLGRVCWDVFSDAQRVALQDVAQRAVANQRPARIEGYDPAIDRWLETRLYPTPDGLIAFTADMSDRKRLEMAWTEAVARESEARAAAEEASRLKDEFLAVVSHELRTPLNAILGWARMLRDGSLAPEAFPKALQTIEHNARMQAQLVEDLLDVSRIVSGKLLLQVEAVLLASVINAALEVVRPAATSKTIDLTFDMAEPSISVSGDPGRLQQAIWNLLTNAVKFTPAGGRVAVDLRRDGADAIVTVRDTGVGIPAAALPFIFDRFRQADSRTTRVYGGLGLGLAIVEYVAEAHGGSVRAESDGSGHGAVFELRLPARAGVVAAAERVPPDRPDLQGRRVLVVDDEADARDLVSAALRHRGAIVVAAASVTEAVALVESMAPDVLVGDVGMPGQDGFELLRRVRAIPGLEHLPAIALTAYTSQPYRDAARAVGYERYLAKPIDPDVLCSAIVEVCRT